MPRSQKLSMTVSLAAFLVLLLAPRNCHAQPRWAAIQVENRTGANIVLWRWFDGRWRQPTFNLQNEQWTQWLINKQYWIYAYSPGIDGFLFVPLDLNAVYRRNRSAVVEIRTTSVIQAWGRLSKKYALYVKIPLRRDQQGRVVQWRWYRYGDFLR